MCLFIIFQIKLYLSSAFFYLQVNFSSSPMEMRLPVRCSIRRNFLSGIQVEFKQSPHQRSLRAQLYWLQVPAFLCFRNWTATLRLFFIYVKYLQILCMWRFARYIRGAGVLWWKSIAELQSQDFATSIERIPQSCVLM